jgi:hypothetical protein
MVSDTSPSLDSFDITVPCSVTGEVHYITVVIRRDVHGKRHYSFQGVLPVSIEDFRNALDSYIRELEAVLNLRVGGII